MPTKPNEEFTGNSVQILNSIRNEAGESYQSVVPLALAPGDIVDGESITKDRALQRLREIGQALRVYEAAQNTFITTLVNRIGLVILSNRLYENPWKAFKRGVLEYGETIEEIFVNILQAKQFDPDESVNTLFRRNMPNVETAFHRLNYQKFYKVTVSHQQLAQAFLSFEGVTDLVSKIIESLYTSANYDEFLMMKYLVARSVLDGGFYPVSIPALSKANSEDIVIAMKNISEQATFMHTEYNEAGVATYTDKSSQYFILNTQFLSTIDVAVLARAFNLEYTQLMGHTVSVNSFTFSPLEEQRVLNLLYPDGIGAPASLFTQPEQSLLANLPGVLIDESWMMIFDNLLMMKQVENGEGLYWNYILHNWKTFSHSPFNTAIAFTTEASSVTGVTVTPATATIKKGSELQLMADVATTGFAPKGVYWTVEGGTTSSVNPQGLLIVPGTETAGTLTVKAVSLYDPSKVGTATITVNA